MDVKTGTEKLAEIEQQFNVNAVCYGDLRVWPLIRLALWAQLCHPELNVMGLPEESEYGRRSLLRSVIKNARTILKIGKYLKGNMSKLCFHKGRLKKIVGKPDIDIIFFSRPEDHRAIFGGRFVNTLLDPMIELIREKQNYIKIEIDSDLVKKNIPRFEHTVFINAIRYFIKNRLIEINGKSSRVDKLNNFIELNKKVTEITNGISINEKYFLNQIRVIKEYEDFFIDVLSIIRPKVVFLVCYYYPVAMSLISACRRLGVKTVDVQHGKQGKYHGMYTHWTKVPEEGYEMLPDFFWVWGEETRQNIQRWHPDGLKKNIPVVGGNIWLSQWIHADQYEEVSDKDKDFIKRLGEYRKIILYTAQPIPDFFPDCLLEAMQMSPDSWIWLLRLHTMQRNQLAEFDNFLQTRGLDNYEIMISSEMPLYSLLKKTDHHITCWSSVCYEAIYFDVSTTIVHPNGAALYEEYIEKGIFTYTADGQELLVAIESAGNKEPPIEEVPYIETDPQRALEAVEVILGA